MPIIEIAILTLIFILSFFLIRKSFYSSIVLLLILSVLLHKEFFSIYRWDVLPVRIFMLAFFLNLLFEFLSGIKKYLNRKNVREFFSYPFIVFISLFWVINGISIIFTRNLTASILYFAFQTTVFALGIAMFFRFKSDPESIKKLIKTYIFVVFGLTIFGFVQMFVYIKTGFIFGALWNVHGRLPRIGTTFWDVNHFAALLASLLPVFGMYILVAKKWKDKIIYTLMFLPMSILLVLTNSRSAWILAGVALMTFALIYLVKKWGAKGIYALLTVIVLAISLGVMEYSDRASPFRRVVKDYFHYRLDSFDAHMLLLEGAYQVFENYPYLGGGTGGFYEQFSETDIAPMFFSRDPIFLTEGFRAPGHSIWGETLAETGAIGMFIFIMLMGYVLSLSLYAAFNSDSYEKFLLNSAMFSSLVGFLVAAIFYSYKSEFFWLIFFLYFLYAYTQSGSYDLQKHISFFVKPNKYMYAVLIILSFALIFTGLGKNHFIPWDEAIYAKIAKNMVTTSDYMTLRWHPEKLWFEKPPLYIWMEALSMKVFGITEFAARFPSAVLGIGTVFLVYFVSHKMFNRTTAFLSSIVLLTTTQFIYYSRTSMMDVSVAFFMTASLVIYYKTFKEGTHYKNWILLGIFIGLGALIKNVVGFLPFLIILLNEIYLVSTNQRLLNKRQYFKYLVSLLVSLVIFLPWHIVMFVQYGKNFIDTYFFYHILERGTSAIEEKGHPFFWYLMIIRVSMRIWFVALLGAIPFAIFRSLFKKSVPFTFLLIWTLVIFLFFSISTSKIVWYIIPIYPVLAIVVGRFIEQSYEFISEYIKLLNKPLAKLLFLYSFVAFSLFYIFLVRELVYPSDQTGAQAQLLQQKDAIYGLDLPIHVDKVELPLIMFYTDGKFIEIDYDDLGKKLRKAPYDRQMVFLTKESRFEDYVKEVPEIDLVNKMGDFNLGFLDSQYNRDTSELKRVQKERSVHQEYWRKKVSSGQSLDYLDYNRMAELDAAVLEVERRIEAGLLTLEKEASSKSKSN